MLIEYFNIYSMLGIKYNDYLDWNKVYQMFVNKEHLSLEGKQKIKLIKSNMNSRIII